jgi:AcrR family transcriptional regulator
VSRSQQVIDDTMAERIVQAALDCLHERGFPCTGIRDIAATAGVPVARVYEMHGSKQALLFEIVNAAYDGIIAQTLAALADAPKAPAAQLDAAMWALSDYPTRHPREVTIALQEGRHLADGARARIHAKRHRLQDVVTEILRDGVRVGCFSTSEPEAVSRALLTMAAAIPSWYDPTGLQTPRRIARTYRDLGARMAGLITADTAPAELALAARLTTGRAA